MGKKTVLAGTIVWWLLCLFTATLDPCNGGCFKPSQHRCTPPITTVAEQEGKKPGTG